MLLSSNRLTPKFRARELEPFLLVMDLVTRILGETYPMLWNTLYREELLPEYHPYTVYSHYRGFMGTNF